MKRGEALISRLSRRPGRRKQAPWWGLLLAGGGLLALSWLLWSACGRFPSVSAGVRRVSHWAGAAVSRVTGWIPFPLSEWVVGAAVLLPLGFLIVRLIRRDWKRLGRGFCRWILLLCAGVFLFIFFYGVHHTAPSLASQLGLKPGRYSQAQLEVFVDYAARKADALASQVPREGEDCAFGSFRELSGLVEEEYRRLGQRYAVFDRMMPGRVKRSLLGGRIMSWVDLAGYYFPWTGESVVSSDVVQSHIPFDLAHELAHGLGIGPEAECNFAAFLACKDSGDTRLAYSGWLCAYVYANNALYRLDPEAAGKRSAALSPEVRHDLQVLSDSLRRFEGPVNRAGSAVNDALIKATGQPDGVASYGKVVDLLLAYYYTANE